MNLFNKLTNVISNPRRFWTAIIFRISFLLPSKLYLMMLYRIKCGHKIDLKHPRTFQEKIQWLKLHDKNPKYHMMVDKLYVKEYVSKIIGDEYIIPTLGVWDSVDDIEFDLLPSSFVLKTTHGGGNCGVYICRDKNRLNIELCKSRLKHSLKQNIYRYLREWPYKFVPKKIIAEEFIDTPNCSDLIDYKFYCFNGEAKYCQVIRDRNSIETIDFYDMRWQHQDFVGLNPVAQNGLNPVAQPVNLDTMKEICAKLSLGIPFVRIDLYEDTIRNRVLFGEITFYPASGFGSFFPVKWNEILGSYINLNIDNNKSELSN